MTMSGQNGQLLSVGLLQRLMGGEHPVGVYREHRGMSVDELADLSGVSAADIRAMESGASMGSVAAREKLALKLRVPLRELAPAEGRRERSL